jgi:signal transduction histidine kinase
MRVTLISAVILIVACLLLAALIIYSSDVLIIDFTSIPKSESTQASSEDDQDSMVEFEYTYPRRQFFLYADISICVVLVAGVVAVYFATGFALKPVNTMCSKISEIDVTKTGQRIDDFTAGKELNDLKTAFNQLLERTDEAIQREKRFSAGAAHELRTPLTIIKTNLDVLRLSDRPTDEEYAQTISVVEDQTKRMTKLVKDLFAMTALEGYEISETVHLDLLMGEIVDEYKGLSPYIHWQISMSPCTVTANAVMIKHALSNLVQNAIKYNTADGTIAVSVRNEETACIVEVADTGIGISEEAAQHIFEPFYREDKSRSRKIGGAGLGLAIAYDIITDHGGTITYHPNQTQGSVFVVRMQKHSLSQSCCAAD